MILTKYKVDKKDFHVNLILDFVIVEVDGDKVTSMAYSIIENPDTTGPNDNYIYNTTPFDTVVKIGSNVTVTL